MANKKLTAKEWLFCRYYLNTNNAREAAAKSGILIFPEKAGERMLKKERIQKELRRMRREQNLDRSEIICGLKRLAFGSIADCVRLLSEDELEGVNLDELDLYNISEIKRNSTKGVEIKFFDRLKALERLIELSQEQETSAAQDFFNALHARGNVKDDF